jgi:hypothetical protein
MSPEHQEVNLESSETEGDLPPYLLAARNAQAESLSATDIPFSVRTVCCIQRAL